MAVMGADKLPGPVQGHAGSFGGRKAAAGIGNCEQYMPRIRAFGNMADGKMHRAGICGPNRAFEQQAQNVAKIAANPAVKLGKCRRHIPAKAYAGIFRGRSHRVVGIAQKMLQVEIDQRVFGRLVWNNRRAADNFGHPVGCCEHIFREFAGRWRQGAIIKGRAFAHDLVKRRAQGLLPFLVNLACQRGRSAGRPGILLGVFAGNQPQVGVLERGCIGIRPLCGAQIGQDQVAVAFWLGPVWLELQAPIIQRRFKIDNFSIWRVRGIFFFFRIFPRGAAIMRGACGCEQKRAQGHAPERRAGKQIRWDAEIQAKDARAREDRRQKAGQQKTA